MTDVSSLSVEGLIAEIEAVRERMRVEAFAECTFAETVERLLASAARALQAQQEAKPAICSQQVVTWLKAYASLFLVHNLNHRDVLSVIQQLERSLPAPPALHGGEP